MRAIISAVTRFGADPNDDAELAQQKRLLLISAAIIFWAGLLWGALYFYSNERSAAFIPWGYSTLSAISIAVFSRSRNFPFFRFAQLALILLLPFLLQLMLGGFIQASAVVLWSLIAPIGALIFCGPRAALRWFFAYLAFVIISGFLQPSISRDNNLPPSLVIFFFVLNLGAISATAFLLLSFFLSQRERAFGLLRLEEEKSNNLLLNILPSEIAAKLKDNPGTIDEAYDHVSILFADVVNFTPLAAQLAPRDMVGILNEIFSYFDSLVDEYGVEKIETVGDEYMAACGVPRVCADHALSIARLSLGMRRYMESFHAVNGTRLQLRIGIHSGPIVAGVIGKKKFAFELFGDTVNTANRMQSHGVPGKIQISRDTYELINDQFICEPRGKLDVKGKGEMETWFLVAETTFDQRRAEEPNKKNVG